MKCVGQDSSVGIVPCHRLDVLYVQVLVAARFSAPVQTSPGAHSPSYTMGTGCFPGVKQAGHGVDHPPSSSTEVKERVELYLCSTSGPLWPVIG